MNYKMYMCIVFYDNVSFADVKSCDTYKYVIKSTTRFYLNTFIKYVHIYDK